MGECEQQSEVTDGDRANVNAPTWLSPLLVDSIVIAGSKLDGDATLAPHALPRIGEGAATQESLQTNTYW